MKTNRRGFTMIELLVVLAVMLILAALAIAVFNGRNSDRMRSSARIAQSAFLGAKDRALHAKDLRGIRLIRDTTDNTLVTALVYLQPLPMQTYSAGSITLERQLNPNPPPPAISADIVILHGYDASSPAPPPNFIPVDWAQKAQFFPNPFRVRIPAATGQWYTAFVNMNGSYALAQGNEYLQLQTPFVQQPPNPGINAPPAITAWPVTSAFSSCDIQLGNDLLPFHQPISLPSSVVIDLKFCSSNVQALAGSPAAPAYVDLMFSPRGMLTGPIAAQGPLHFLLRDLQDATAGANPFAFGAPASANPDTSRGERLILTVFPQTGLVGTFDIDQTDADGDGVADNPFNFAQLGKAAAR